MSYVEIKSFQYQGLERKEVSVQGIKTRGLSQLSLSGNLSSSLRDSRDKIKAVVAQHAPWGPVDKILLNLLPSDVSKFSPELELPMTLTTLALLWPEPLTPEQTERLGAFYYSGSISLSGDLAAADLSTADGTSVATFKKLEELWAFVLRGELPLCEIKKKKSYFKIEAPTADGRAREKFFLQLAADAQVPALLVGPPGIGKSHLARWALSCVPEPDSLLRAQVDRIWTLAGKEVLPQVPFQNPHSRTHLSEFVGVARHDVPRPGIFSLAHGGLLVLDEFPELARDSREILRNILDEKTVLKNTRAGFCVWPASFWLILTANPCPCGFARGKDLSKCRCLEKSRLNYLARFSGPLLDRIGVKMFLTEKEIPLPAGLVFRASRESAATDLDFLRELSLNPRERTLYQRLWRACVRRVEPNACAQSFFQEFVEGQKSFANDWLVHVYG